MAIISFYERVLLVSLLTFANTNCQDVCREGAGIIGSENNVKYEAEERSRGRLYLNIDNPAQCSGIITSWEYCYYLPDNERAYQVHFAIYRKRIDDRRRIQYEKQSRTVTLSLDMISDDDGDGDSDGESEDSDSEVENFFCTSHIPEAAEYVTVRQGDIIGMCLPRRNSLNVVSDTSDEDLDGDRLFYTNCNNNVPGVINDRFVEIQDGRIAHLYAQITADNGARITTTDSELVTPMARPAPDHPQNEPKTDISMLSPSQSLDTSSFIGGQLDLRSTSVALPITQTSTATSTSVALPITQTSTATSTSMALPITQMSTATVASTTTAISTPVVSSFRGQSPTASISTGGTVVTSTNTFMSTRGLMTSTITSTLSTMTVTSTMISTEEPNFMSTPLVLTTQTSTTTIASTTTAISTPTVSSFRGQTPTITISTGGTVLTSTNTFTSTRGSMTSITTNTLPTMTVVSSTMISSEEPNFMSTQLVFTTRTSTVDLQPISTTRNTFSTEQSPPPGQLVTVSSSSFPMMTTSPPGPQTSQQRSLNTAATVIIVLVVIAFVVLSLFLVVILVRKYGTKRYRYYPPFKHTLLEEDESIDSNASTIVRFDNVLYSNYTEMVQIQDKAGHMYDYTTVEDTKPMENTYSEVQAESTTESYSYAVISGQHCTQAPHSSSLEQRLYDPNRESRLNIFCAPASKESELYAQLKFCGVKNIKRDTIEATEHLGSGQFGDVKKGLWRNEKLKVQVALKTLKEGSQQEDKVKFLQEAAIMAQFSHPNVAVLYGVVSKGEPIMLVVELVEKGNLLEYLAFLKENNDIVHLPNLPNILLNFSRQVALGMRYLSEKGFVHRDLAARNILVSSDDVCKIADFGMSRDLADENYYISHGGVIPVKWTAPEAINYKKYSTASDVWSYGCLLYEIWSLGHKPYENLSNLQVIRHVELGQRLTPPPGCPRKIYELMIFCWNPDVAFRPKFSDLALILVSDRKEVLVIPQEDINTHQLAGMLGTPLAAGERMYIELQNRYVFS